MAPAAIPAFDETGNLPPGVYGASLEEFIARFCHGEGREHWGSVLTEVLALAHSTGRLETVYLFGSFVTAKMAPADLVQRHVHFVLLLCLGSARVRAKLKLEIYQTIST